MKPPRLASFIEALEARIAPATLVSPTTLTYTDVDGDAVTVQISKGTLTAADFVFNTEFGTVGNQQLLRIDFSGDKDKAGADLTISVVPALGDGFAHIGFIDATGIDLGDVIIPGDLGRISAGDTAKSTAAVDQVTVRSIGVQPVATTQGAGGNLDTALVGGVNNLTVLGDINGATIGVEGSIGVLEVGGDVIGGSDAMSGAIRSKGSITQAHVAGDLIGGNGNDSGQIFARHDIGSLTIDGSIIGGTLAGSHRTGQVAAFDRIGEIIVGGNVQGGAGDQSAQIAARDGISSLTIGGALTGGDGFESAVIGSRGKIVSAVIKGGIAGGAGSSSGSILADALIQSVVVGDTATPANLTGGIGNGSGIIVSTKGIGDVVIHGSVMGGDGDTSGAIGSTAPLRSVRIEGDLVGGVGPRSGEVVSAASMGDVTITGGLFGGQGQESGAVGSTGAIKSVSVGGSFFGGIGFSSGWIVSSAKIGSIHIGGDAGARGSFSGIIECNGLISSIAVDGSIGNVEGDPATIRAGRLGSLEVGDSIFSGSSQAQIRVDKTIGSITVARDVSGSGFGRLGIFAGTSIDSISIGGSISFSQIVVGGGFQDEGGGKRANPDGHVGTINVAGSWLSTSVAVGTLIGFDGLYGTSDDTIAHGGKSGVLGTIDGITIGGSATVGSAQGGNGAGIVAEYIKSISIGGEPVALQRGPLNDLINLDPQGGNFYAREKEFGGGVA